MPCKFVTQAFERQVNCSVIDGMVGARCGTPKSLCEECKYPDDDFAVRAMAKQHIRNLLVSGNGRVNYADTVDVPAMATRFKAISTKGEREEVVAKAIECQCIPEEDGGHDAETVTRKLGELARALNESDTLKREL